MRTTQTYQVVRPNGAMSAGADIGSVLFVITYEPAAVDEDEHGCALGILALKLWAKPTPIILQLASADQRTLRLPSKVVQFRSWWEMRWAP